MQSTASTPSLASAWSDLVDADRERASERRLLRELLAVLAGELEASVARVTVSQDGVQLPDLVVRTGDSSSGEGGILVVPVPGAEVSFEGMPPGSSACLDGPRLAALSAAVRALEQAEDVKRHRFEVNYRGVALDALYDVGLSIAATLNLDELSEEILMRAVSLLDARRGAFFRADDGEFRLARTFGGRAAERVTREEFEDLVCGQSDGEIEILPGSRHVLAVPIGVEPELKGLLAVGDKESRAGVGPFASGDRRTLELFANQAAIALENAYLHRQALEKERLEREGELAAEIQRRLLPETTPDIRGFELTGWSRSARRVGGDYYNYIRLEDGSLFIVLADVTGKGMPAALLVSTFDSALRLLLGQGLRGERLLAALNRHIFSSSASNTFITVAAIELDPRAGKCRYLSGGHNPSLWLRADGATGELGATGLPIGMFEHSTYGFEEADLSGGEVLCLYSDGITECLSSEEEEYGIDRLAQTLARHGERPLPEIGDSIRQQIDEFQTTGERGDDQTVVLLRRS